MRAVAHLWVFRDFQRAACAGRRALLSRVVIHFPASLGHHLLGHGSAFLSNEARVALRVARVSAGLAATLFERGDGSSRGVAWDSAANWLLHDAPRMLSVAAAVEPENEDVRMAARAVAAAILYAPDVIAMSGRGEEAFAAIAELLRLPVRDTTVRGAASARAALGAAP